MRTMTWMRCAVAILSSGAIAACGIAIGTTTATEARGVEGEIAALEADLRRGMAYGDFRERVLAHGWTPRVAPDCRSAVAGGSAERTCAAHPHLAVCTICDALPELQVCSSDARCLMRFQHPRARDLQVRAYGEFAAWADTGDDPGLQLSAWSFVPPDTP